MGHIIWDKDIEQQHQEEDWRSQSLPPPKTRGRPRVHADTDDHWHEFVKSGRPYFSNNSYYQSYCCKRCGHCYESMIGI